ncbi:sigma factor [Bacillaceae bacterium IKA-2]|nr:sigma factor [Bacillaceae bacterium IKA-2]
MNNQDQITSWFRQYGDDVLNFLIYYTGKMDLEALLQEVFIKAMRKETSFRYEYYPKIWMFSIARNVAIDASGKRTREKKKETKLFLELNQEHHPPPEKIYQQRNYKDVIILRVKKGDRHLFSPLS